MSFNLLKLLKFKSFCNVNQHYLITPPPSSPLFSPPISPYSFFGGGGRGRGGRGRAGNHCTAPPPERRGGDEVPPPSPPQDFTKKNFFTQVKTYKNFFLSKYSNHLQNLCNLPTLEERRQSTAQNYKKNLWCPLNKKTKFIVAYFNEILKI